MSNYISAVTPASPAPPATPGVSHAAALKAAGKAVAEDQDAEVTLSTAALALSQGGTSSRPAPLSLSSGSANADVTGPSVRPGQTAGTPAEPAAAAAKPVVQYVDLHTEEADESTAAKVKLSTAAQVLSMNQTGSSVDEIAAVLGMTIADVSSELGLSSTVAPASAASAAPATAHL